MATAMLLTAGRIFGNLWPIAEQPPLPGLPQSRSIAKLG